MSSVLTTRLINPSQLAEEIGVAVSTNGGAPETTDPKEIIADEVTEATLAAAVQAHIADPLWGVPDEDRDLSGLRNKARAVFNGTDTFTAAQVQKIVAGLVLKSTRP